MVNRWRSALRDGDFWFKNGKQAGKGRLYLLILGLIMGFAGYNCLSEKGQTNNDNSYYDEIPSNGYHGEDIPFGESQDVYVSFYICNAYYANKDFACKVEIKSKGGVLYAFPNGGTRGYRIENAPYDAPGAYFIVWGSTPIYF